MIETEQLTISMQLGFILRSLLTSLKLENKTSLRNQAVGVLQHIGSESREESKPVLMKEQERVLIRIKQLISSKKLIMVTDLPLIFCQFKTQHLMVF